MKMKLSDIPTTMENTTMKQIHVAGTLLRLKQPVIAMLVVVGCIIATATLRAQPGLLVAHDSAERTDSLARSYKMVLKDGGPSGFYSTHETSTDEPTPRHLLICVDPGYEKGEFATAAKDDRERPHLIDYAREQITSGKASGRYETFANRRRYVVEWEGTDLNNCTIEEWQYEPRQ